MKITQNKKRKTKYLFSEKKCILRSVNIFLTFEEVLIIVEKADEIETLSLKDTEYFFISFIQSS